MTHNQILVNRKANESLLMDYFSKVNVPTERLQKVQVYNGRNNLVPALQLTCKDIQEFDYHKSSFFFADKKGGDFCQYDARFFKLVITIKDEWN